MLHLHWNLGKAELSDLRESEDWDLSRDSQLPQFHLPVSTFSLFFCPILIPAYFFLTCMNHSYPED